MALHGRLIGLRGKRLKGYLAFAEKKLRQWEAVSPQGCLGATFRAAPAPPLGLDWIMGTSVEGPAARLSEHQRALLYSIGERGKDETRQAFGLSVDQMERMMTRIQRVLEGAS